MMMHVTNGNANLIHSGSGGGEREGELEREVERLRGEVRRGGAELSKMSRKVWPDPQP